MHICILLIFDRPFFRHLRRPRLQGTNVCQTNIYKHTNIIPNTHDHDWTGLLSEKPIDTSQDLTFASFVLGNCLQTETRTIGRISTTQLKCARFLARLQTPLDESVLFAEFKRAGAYPASPSFQTPPSKSHARRVGACAFDLVFFIESSKRQGQPIDRDAGEASDSVEFNDK